MWFTMAEEEIFNCIENDDVEALKLLTNYPNLFLIEDASGLTILQKAIYENAFAIFDFLLSLDDCPINARNSKGTTVLQLAQRLFSKSKVIEGVHFVYCLLKKGVDITDSSYEITLLLHDAVDFNHIRLAKLLIEKGADLNCCDDDGQTPFHKLRKLRHGMNRNELNELFPMMLYFGADPSIPNNEGYRPIDFAFEGEYLSESVQEHLVFYFFDDYCTGYDIPLGNLFGLLESNYSFVPQVLKHITSVNLDISAYVCEFFQTHFKKLLTIKPKYLKLLLEKFDYVIENIVDVTLNHCWTKCIVPKKIENFENFHLLLQSRFSSDIIQIINKTGICHFLAQARRSKISRIESCNLVLILLSYGVNIYDDDLEIIYENFSRSEFFRILLHMDIKMRNRRRDIMPGLFYDIHAMDIETFLTDPDKYGCSPKTLKQLLKYFAHPKVKSYCCSRSKDICGRVKDLPTVPLLVELARDKVRKFLIEKYKIENSMQFYTLVKHLPISKFHEKIITLETKLY